MFSNPTKKATEFIKTNISDLVNAIYEDHFVSNFGLDFIIDTVMEIWYDAIYSHVDCELTCLNVEDALEYLKNSKYLYEDVDEGVSLYQSLDRIIIQTAFYHYKYEFTSEIKQLLFSMLTASSLIKDFTLNFNLPEELESIVVRTVKEYIRNTLLDNLS